jgi:hypothetical protein
LGREEPGKTIESERFLQHTDPEFTIRMEGGASRAPTAFDGVREEQAKRKRNREPGCYLGGQEVVAAALARGGGCGGGR